jgi:hypothetical protein
MMLPLGKFSQAGKILPNAGGAALSRSMGCGSYFGAKQSFAGKWVPKRELGNQNNYEMRTSATLMFWPTTVISRA